jgi:dihydroxyacid dehydratase/phosphogluconate dehydratase
VLETADPGLLSVATHARGPAGALPLTAEMLLTQPSGNLFGLTQNAGMGWDPDRLLDPEFLILSTHGGLRADNGEPIALGFHTGHWEVGLLVAEAARELKALHAVPFAGACTDPCDGRTQGTAGMLDSLPFRNDAAIVLRRLMRSLPTGKGVIGIATCDKGLPAMMMALASAGKSPPFLFPEASRFCPSRERMREKFRPSARASLRIRSRWSTPPRWVAAPARLLAAGASSWAPRQPARWWERRWDWPCLTPRSRPPANPSGWMRPALGPRDLRLHQLGIGVEEVLTPAAIRNAMVLHAAFGGSTNLLLHIPAIAHAAKLQRPTASDWAEVNRQTPRLVDALPNGPRNFATVQVFLAGGVPEVMLHLREAGLLDTSVMTVSGESLGASLDWWRESPRRYELRRNLTERDGIDPDDVIMSPDRARSRGLTSTICFPVGNLAPEGSVIKSTAIDPSLVDEKNVYRHLGPARVFVTEEAAIQAIKSGQVAHGDVIVLICGGPAGAGMQEIYQITSALKQLPHCKHVAVLTDARFSGVSTGACIGHISPEALAGGPIGKIQEGDRIEIVIDRESLTGSLHLVGDADEIFGAEEGSRRLAQRKPRADLRPHPQLPDDTRLWAALVHASGGVWGGCVYDVDKIVSQLKEQP